MASLWNSLTETVTDYATPLKNSVVDLLNEADEQAADFLTPQQQDTDDDSPKTQNSNLGEHNDITSPREYVVKLLKEENESLKTLIHQQTKEMVDRQAPENLHGLDHFALSKLVDSSHEKRLDGLENPLVDNLDFQRF